MENARRDYAMKGRIIMNDALTIYNGTDLKEPVGLPGIARVIGFANPDGVVFALLCTDAPTPSNKK
jgi:hypothetical protein